MAKHIGIVACSYAGASLCYQTICNEGSTYLGNHAHPEVSLHTHPLSEYMICIERDDWQGVAELMISSAGKLTKIGAEVLICPDNTIHQSFSIVKTKVSTPWLHIAEEVIKASLDKNFRKLGILGTKYLIEGPVYPEFLDKRKVGYEIPTPGQRIQINTIIFDELVYGIIKEDSRKILLSIIDELKSKGCDAVILGCTELPLIVFQNESSLPLLDSTRLLARAALKEAISTDRLS